MENHRDIIKAPLISEKTATMQHSENKYVFSVDVRANKVQIKQAIEAIFSVKVENVNVINVKPKRKRVGRYYGTRNKVKKAIVTLKEGNSIEF